MKLISELFRHKGYIFVYCSSVPVKQMFERHLDEQGFAFEDGTRVTERKIADVMVIGRDYTVKFCSRTFQMICGSLQDPVYVKGDHSRGSIRVDYARFISGEENYVIRGPQEVYFNEERRDIQTAFLTAQPLTARQRSILREFLASLNEEGEAV